MMKAVICNKCKWIHFSKSRKSCEEEVTSFNQYYDTLTPEKQDLYYGSKKSSLDTYLKCFRCGNDYKDFREALPEEIPYGSTIQPIMDFKE